MTITPRCIEVTLDRRSEHPYPIAWCLFDPTWRYYTPIVLGTMAPNETTYSVCFDDERASSWSCARLDAFPSLEARLDAFPSLEDTILPTDDQQHIYEEGNLRVQWAGVVWADQLFGLTVEGLLGPLVWIGDFCHLNLYEVCGDNDDLWLLDVALTTANDTNYNSVYWRIFGEWTGSRRSNILDDPYWNRYEPSTSYRTLRCIDSMGAACTEFGLENRSTVISTTVRVNGQEKTEIYSCHEDFCDGDVVTPLRGCSPALTTGAIAGIAIAVVVTASGLLLWLGMRWYKRRHTAMDGDLPMEYPHCQE